MTPMRRFQRARDTLPCVSRAEPPPPRHADALPRQRAAERY